MKTKMKSIGGSLLITLSFVVFVGIISSVAMMIMKNPMDHISLISGAAQLLYLVPVLIIFKIKKISFTERCYIKTVPLKKYLFPVIAAFGFSSFSSIIQESVPIPQSLLGNATEDLGNSVAAYIAAIFIIAPIIEEIVFRGLIMTRLRKTFSAGWAIFFSALLFGFIHLMTGSVVTAIHAFLGGLIFALTYEKIGSLIPAVIAHFSANVGGLVPGLVRNCDVIVQYGIAVVFAVISVLACIVIAKSKIRV